MPNTCIDAEDQKNFLITLTIAVTKKNIDDIQPDQLEQTIVDSYNKMLNWMMQTAKQNNDLVFAKEIKDMQEGKKKQSLHSKKFDTQFKQYYLGFLQSLKK